YTKPNNNNLLPVNHIPSEYEGQLSQDNNNFRKTKQPANQQPDELTRIIQKKFFSHQATLFSTILESYDKILENQEHLYALLLITRIPSRTIDKPFTDKCRATKKLIPINIP
ncbi:MAG: hypothetical protein ACK559_40855, partial [bacterium]